MFQPPQNFLADFSLRHLLNYFETLPCTHACMHALTCSTRHATYVCAVGNGSDASSPELSHDQSSPADEGRVDSTGNDRVATVVAESDGRYTARMHIFDRSGEWDIGVRGTPEE